MSTTSRYLLRLVAITIIALAVAGCGRTESYRYKLTMAVNTPDGVKRVSSVARVAFWGVSIPERGIMQKLTGEALYLDLGPGRRPLIALLTSYLHRNGNSGMNYTEFIKSIRWSREFGPSDNLLSELYGPPPKWDPGGSPRPGNTYTDWYMNNVRRIAQMRGPQRIAPNDLPDLVTFDDINDPKTVILVDPNDLQATLGPDITWNEIMLEITDEPITTGLKTRLPWLPAYYQGMLDGARYHDKSTLANTLSTPNFQSVDLMRSEERGGNLGDLLRAVLR